MLYDEGCDFCSRLARWLASRARTVDVQPIGSPAGAILLRDLDVSERYAAVHAVDELGRRRTGGAAVPPILASLPGLTPIAVLADRHPRLTALAYDVLGVAWRARAHLSGGRSGELLAHELADDRAVGSPGDRGITSAITRPRSRIDVAPTSAITSSTISSSSSSESWLGHELLDHLELELLAFGNCSCRPAAASKASIASTRFLRSRCSTCSDSSSESDRWSSFSAERETR